MYEDLLCRRSPQLRIKKQVSARDIYPAGVSFWAGFDRIEVERQENGMCNIAVCDDSALDRKYLMERIDRIATNQELRIYEFESGIELLEAMNDIQFAAVFLDIQMKDMSGDDTAKKIRDLDDSLILVFYTGYATVTPERLEVLPFRYLMKNMPDAQFDEYIKATLNKVEECNRMPMLAANLQKRAIYINSKFVIYIEKYKKSTRAELVPIAYDIYGIKADEHGKYPDVRISDPLEKTYEKLKRYGFGCPHDSYIINFEYMNTCTARLLGLEGVDIEFPIARSKAKEFHALKGQFIRAKYVGSDES